MNDGLRLVLEPAIFIGSDWRKARRTMGFDLASVALRLELFYVILISPMQSDPELPAQNPPPISPIKPPVIPPALAEGFPPPLPLQKRKAESMRRGIALVLSLCLGLFLADGVVSLLDDSFILLFGLHALTAIRGIIFLLALVIAIVVYGLMGLTPMIPKRLFLPITLFGPAAGLAAILFTIYFYSRIQQISWILSFIQVLLGLAIVFWLCGGFKFRWPLVAEEQLRGRAFSWWNLSAFLLINAFVLLPAVLGYLFMCAGLAVHRFSDGFVALRPSGLMVQVRKYARNDGKMIQLVPMSHVGESEFYRDLSESFPTNALILMEGVTDNRNLLTNKITYHRMANTFGLAEQQKEFRPEVEIVPADIDVAEFEPQTIDLLNLMMFIHAKGLNVETLQALMRYPTTPGIEEQLFDDLLRKRNRHLLKELNARLSESDNIVVPWGAAHMPEIAREIQKSGFHLVESQTYTAIRFSPHPKGKTTLNKEEDVEQQK